MVKKSFKVQAIRVVAEKDMAIVYDIKKVSLYISDKEWHSLIQKLQFSANEDWPDFIHLKYALSKEGIRELSKIVQSQLLTKKDFKIIKAFIHSEKSIFSYDYLQTLQALRSRMSALDSGHLTIIYAYEIS